jgi:broad-specificity NMP kinase
MTLNEREIYYEQQIKEYENNLNQAIRETQCIQGELEKLEQEKILHDNKLNTIINLLKQDHEILKSQLNEFQNQGLVLLLLFLYRKFFNRSNTKYNLKSTYSSL